MKRERLTDSELLLLGLVAEMPRHGYELEQVIAGRGMREWSQIGFSSIYFVLGRLESKGLVASEIPATAKSKKSFSLTPKGHETLTAETIAAFSEIRSTSSPLIMGMLHWNNLERSQALSALQQRSALVAQEIERLRAIRFEQQPLPDHVDALFDFSIQQLQAESAWISQTLAYMQTKPWNDTDETTRLHP